MNRALLLVICDFLLLSLLAIARFEDPAEEPEATETIAIHSEPDDASELVDVLKVALESEQENREQLYAELSESEKDIRERDQELGKTQEELDQTRKELEAREDRLNKTAEELKLTEAEARKLAEAKRKLEEEKAALAALKTNIEQEKEAAARRAEQKERELMVTQKETRELVKDLTASKERLKAVQEHLADREEALAKAEENASLLAEEREALRQSRETLQTELQVSRAQAGIMEENLTAARTEIATVRTEKDQIQRHAERLGEGVQSLAQTSTEIQQEIVQTKQEISDTKVELTQKTEAIQEEIRFNAPKTSNTIFADWKANRVELQFEATLDGVFGGRSRSYSAPSLFVTDGSHNYALVAAFETPFRVETTSGRIRAANAVMVAGTGRYQINEIFFLASDPRVIAIRVPRSILDHSGATAFNVSKEPLKFPEAVLVGSSRGFFGETSFRLDPGNNHYLKMQNKLFNRLFGEFAPSRGDIVFSKTGEFVGLMVDGNYSFIVDDFTPAYTLQLGDRFKSDYTQSVRRELSKRVDSGNLPGGT